MALAGSLAESLQEGLVAEEQYPLHHQAQIPPPPSQLSALPPSHLFLFTLWVSLTLGTDFQVRAESSGKETACGWTGEQSLRGLQNLDRQADSVGMGEEVCFLGGELERLPESLEV